MVRSPRFLTLIAALLLTLLGGCSLTLDFEECASDADCAALAGAGERLTCDLPAGGYCVQAPGECSSDADCTGAAPRTRCEDNACVEPPANNNPVNNNPINNNPVNNTPDTCTNAMCAQTLGANSICDREANQCVSLLSAECTTVEGNATLEKIIVIGSILPTVGDNASKGLPRENAIRLAVKEINDSGGLPDGYRLVLVGCNDGGTSETALAAARHLAGTLKVPAIIGPAFSTPFIDTVTQVTAAAGVFTISPSATSPLITDLDDNDLAWRTVPSDTFQATALADRLRARREANGGSLKVLAFAKDDAYGAGLLNALSDNIGAELGASSYASFIYNPTDAADRNNKVSQGLAAIAAPDVVVIIGTTEGVSILNSLEIILNPAPEDEAPVYLFSDGGQVTELLTAVEAKPDLAARIEGTIPNLENGDLYTTFRNRFRSRFGAEPAAYTGNAYDATYLIAYDLIGLLSTDSPITGASLARNVGRLTQGRTITANPSDFNQGKNTLIAGSDINLEGVSGPLSFDLVTGDTAGNFSLWRVEIPADEASFGNFGDYIIAEDGSGEWTVNP